jgi:hypothetical protein
MIDYGRSRVEKSHSRDLGFVPSLFQLVLFGWIIWDRAGPFGGKCSTISWEGQGVVLTSRHLQGCSPCLCRLRTDGLAPVSEYWAYRSHLGDMGSINLVACCQWMFGFHYCFNSCVRRETGWWTCRSLSQARGCVRSPFLGSSRVHPTLMMAFGRLPRTWTAHRKQTQGIHELAWEVYVSCVSGFSVHGVHWFESPRLSNMSNRLFVAVFT